MRRQPIIAARTTSAAMLRGALRIVVLVVSIAPGLASAKVASTTIAHLFEISDRVVIGRVSSIEKLAGFRWARVQVTHDIEGTGSNEVRGA